MTELSNYKIVGLTGMSGAGKSTVSRLFAENGFCVIDCDKVARSVADNNRTFLREVAERFSPEAIKPDGTLDRAKTAALIFSSPDKKALYNKIIFPYITYNIAVIIRNAQSDVLLDAPTLFEARLDMLCDGIVGVIADAEACLRRIVARDGLTEQQAKNRLSAQHNAFFFRERCGYIIENNSTQEALARRALDTIKLLKDRL